MAPLNTGTVLCTLDQKEEETFNTYILVRLSVVCRPPGWRPPRLGGWSLVTGHWRVVRCWRHAGTRVLVAEVRGTLVAGPVCAAAAAARTALSSPPGSSGGARHLSCAATGAGPGPGHGHQCSTFT